MPDENLAPDAAQASAGSPSPAQNDASPAASVPADAAPELAVGSEAPANGVDPATPPEHQDAGTPPASDATRKPKADRIQELIAERNFWRERAVATPAAKPAAVAPPEPEEPPTLEQHGHDTEAWSKAFTAYHEKRAATIVDQHLTKVREQEQQRQVTETFVSRESAFAAETPDYTEAVADPALQQYVTPTISEAIVMSEIGPKLSYHLATHRDELASIARMRPTQQAIALGKLEARLAAAPSPTAKPAAAPKQPTRAPAPPSPVGANASPSKRVEDMTTEEYMAHRQRWSPTHRA